MVQNKSMDTSAKLRRLHQAVGQDVLRYGAQAPANSDLEGRPPAGNRSQAQKSSGNGRR